jgi:hypothetical protein
MSFREKIHWVTLVTMILAFGWYALAYPWRMAGNPAGIWASAGMLIFTTIAIIIVMTIASAYLAIQTPGERDRSIHLKGTHFAYYPLVLGIWANIVALFWGVGPTAQLNLMLATVVLAELVRIGTQLYLYRRGL